MTTEQNKSPPRTFSVEDADRLLGFADQFLEDWQLHEGKNESEPTAAECAEAVNEFTAIRPLLVAAPALLDALQNFMNGLDTNLVRLETNADETLANALHRMRSAIAKAHGAV